MYQVTERSWLERLAMEPPFRILARAILKRANCAAERRALWELSPRPAYLLGVYAAAVQALSQNVSEISVVELGVAGGNGLIALQNEAESIEQELGVGIRVFGFDSGGAGLPSGTGDYRDHPDFWAPGDFAMDEENLRRRLSERTCLILGDVRETVPRFYADSDPPPLGFISFDLDLYSSTRDALGLLRSPERRMLRQVPIYFDDIEFIFNHRFAGELLAIDEFNSESSEVKIDQWYGVRAGRAFPERGFLEKMYVAHDLAAISRATVDRPTRSLPIG